MKKWTYLVAAGMLLGATPVFTGCIDNDEPEGITILRKAKAELIVAKKAVVDAEALRLKAEASKLEAEAKVKEAEADLTKANAELVRAQAAQLAALTEAEKAKYAAEIAKIEAEIAKIKAETEAAIAQAEATRQAAEDAHLWALAQIEKAKNTLTAEELQMLSMYQTRYDNAANEYNTRYIAYVTAQKEYLNALADAEKRNDNIDYTRYLEKNVETQKENVELKKLELEEAEAKLAEVKAYVPGELAVKLKEAQAEWNKIQDKLNALNVKIAEERIKNDAEYKKQADLEKEYSDLVYSEEGRIFAEPLSIEFPNIGVPGFHGKYDIIEKDLYGFNVNEEGYVVPYGYNNGYTTAINQVNNYISNLTRLQLDKDDQKWTEASINEMTAQLTGLKKIYDADLKTWQSAVDGYNAGNGTQYAKYAGYTELENAIKAYNEAAKKVNPLRKTWNDKAKAKARAEHAYNNYMYNPETESQTALEIREAADREAYNTYWAIADNPNGSAWTTYNATVKSLENAITKALEDVNVAEANVALLAEKLNQDPTNTALQTQLNAAQELLGKDNTEGLRKILSDAISKMNNDEPKAEQKRINAISIAKKERDLALAKNKKDYENHKIDWTAEYLENGEKVNPEYISGLKKQYDDAAKEESEAYALYAPANEEITTRYEALATAYDTFSDNILAYLSGTSIGPNDTYPTIIEQDLNINSAFDEVYNGTAPTFDIKNLVVNSKNFVIVASRVLYGLPSKDDRINDEFYNTIINGLLNAERITPLSKEELDKIIIAEHHLDDMDMEYFAPTWYGFYGSFGVKLAKERDIEYANAFINEQPTIDAVLKTLNDYIANLEAQKDAQGKDVVLPVYNQWMAQNDVIDGFEKANIAEKRELEMKSRLQGDLVNSINEAMLAEGTSEEASRDEAAIERLITQYTDAVKKAKDIVFNAETQLQKAEKALEDWNNDLIDFADYKKLQMENAQYYLDAAKVNLDKAAAELKMILERLGVATEEAE